MIPWAWGQREEGLQEMIVGSVGDGSREAGKAAQGVLLQS